MINRTPLNLNEKVWEIVKKIPKGKVTTYGEIANKLKDLHFADASRSKQNPRQGRGSPQAAKLQISAQLVGWALHANKSADVPCHRVVDRNGRLAPNFGGPSLESFGRRIPSKSRFAGRSGAFDGAKEQRRRLEAEGVKFKDEMHVDLSKFFGT